MASTGKRKTTMAKLNRETKLRQKRVEKAARKDARKLAAANPLTELGPDENGEWPEPAVGEDAEPGTEPVAGTEPAVTDA
jgi:hypothetical protein